MTCEKKFLNKADSIVDDSLTGLVLSSGGQLCFSQKSKRVVISTNSVNRNKVKLISGGGSGHEPFAAGYVGQGMLDAAIAGDIFASPPSRNVLTALEETKSEKGSILFIINYTGDRLNFGLAAERFQATGGKVNVVHIADDVSLDSASKVGRRGLAGVVLIIKMAGEMAERGDDLETITNFCKRANQHIGTIGVSLEPCSLPGEKSMFLIGAGEMEIGLGIHGEPGKERTKIATAQEIVKNLINMLVTKGSKAKDVVLMLNNLGATSEIEMNVLKAEVIRESQHRGLTVKRFLSGTYMTSLNCHSISLTAMEIFSDEVLKLIDAQSLASGWRNATRIESDACQIGKPKEVVDRKQYMSGGPQIVKLKNGLDAVCIEMKNRKNELNHLDGKAGDGDCGSTFAKASDVIVQMMEKKEIGCTNWSDTFDQLAIAFEEGVGGTSGALYAIMLSVAAAHLKHGTQEELVSGFKEAYKAVCEHGKAEPGDRTMVDTLYAVVKYLTENDKEEINWNIVVKVAGQAAQETASMKAAAGRASYTSENMQTDPDAGAMALYYWIKAIVEKV